VKVSIELGPRPDRPGQDIITLSDGNGASITLPRSKLRPLVRLLESMQLRKDQERPTLASPSSK
jgi:hypothetical protein